MDEERLGLSGEEAEILRRSADGEITRRRIRQVIFFVSLFAVLLLLAGPSRIEAEVPSEPHGC